ncbi:MAG TPA: hypothetical protein VNO79_15475 [Actinomycetota bacterium]|nr:hypothetical protein [Actinomycetota bacterium]
MGSAVAVAGLATLGEAGHVLLERLGWRAAHHVFHLAYLGGAVAAFAWLVLRDLRRHGRPRLSWSLGPRRVGGDGRAGARPSIPGIVGAWTGRTPSSPR